MEKIKIKSFRWVDYGQSKRVDWWEINVGLVINDKNYNFHIVKELYLEGDDSKGAGYRIKDNNGNTLYDGLWVKLGWSRYDEVETKVDWMIGDEKGLDVWLKIEEKIENDNGWGIWNVEDINEDYLKELFQNTDSANSGKSENKTLVKDIVGLIEVSKSKLSDITKSDFLYLKIDYNGKPTTIRIVRTVNYSIGEKSTKPHYHYSFTDAEFYKPIKFDTIDTYCNRGDHKDLFEHMDSLDLESYFDTSFENKLDDMIVSTDKDDWINHNMEK